MDFDGYSGAESTDASSSSSTTATTSTSSSSSTSTPSARPVHGILKTNASHTPKPVSHIRWDEDNLIYNETHKTATMKIDEPKTPYHHSPPMSDTEDDDDDDDDASSPDKRGSQHEGRTDNNVNEALDLCSLGSELAGRMKELEQLETLGKPRGVGARFVAPSNTDDDDDDDDEAARERRRQFREKRKQHYNEFQAVQEQKAQNPSKIQRTL